MSGLILCPSCSNNIGEVRIFYNAVYDGFVKDVIKKNKKLKDYHPSKIKSTPGLIPPVKFILDALQLKNDCCRTHIMTVEENVIVYR